MGDFTFDRKTDRGDFKTGRRASVGDFKVYRENALLTPRR